MTYRIKTEDGMLFETNSEEAFVGVCEYLLTLRKVLTIKNSPFSKGAKYDYHVKMKGKAIDSGDAFSVFAFSSDELLTEHMVERMTVGMMYDRDKEYIFLCSSIETNKTKGRPRGTYNPTLKLDGHEAEIISLFAKGLNFTNVARYFCVTRPTLLKFIQRKNIVFK